MLFRSISLHTVNREDCCRLQVTVLVSSSVDNCTKLLPGEVRALTPVRSVRQAKAETPVSLHLCPVYRFYDKLLQDVTDATV